MLCLYVFVLDLNEVRFEIMKSSKDNKMNIFPVVFDEKLWENEIMKSCETFVNEFYDLMVCSNENSLNVSQIILKCVSNKLVLNYNY